MDGNQKYFIQNGITLICLTLCVRLLQTDLNDSKQLYLAQNDLSQQSLNRELEFCYFYMSFNILCAFSMPKVLSFIRHEFLANLVMHKNFDNTCFHETYFTFFCLFVYLQCSSFRYRNTRPYCIHLECVALLFHSYKFHFQVKRSSYSSLII